MIQSNVMKRAVPILIFILILILRQAPSALIEDQGRGSGSNLSALNFLCGTPGLGWIEIMEKGDPGVLSPVFKAFQNEDRLVTGEVSIGHFSYVSHCISDLLLIDKPPPLWRSGFNYFA
jgi:hypothetical protein